MAFWQIPEIPRIFCIFCVLCRWNKLNFCSLAKVILLWFELNPQHIRVQLNLIALYYPGFDFRKVLSIVFCYALLA